MLSIHNEIYSTRNIVRSERIDLEAVFSNGLPEFEIVVFRHLRRGDEGVIEELCRVTSTNNGGIIASKAGHSLLNTASYTRANYIKSTPEITSENILNRKFTAECINEKWLTDVTEFKYGSGGKMYLSAILDLKDKSIIAYAIGHSNNNKLVFDTFDIAIEKYPDAKPLFYSYIGFQYTSKLFRMKLDKQGMKQSMSRVGRYMDNGPMESFWGTLKAEMYYLQHFDCFDALKTAIENYIAFYNDSRYQEKLGGLAPLEFRESLLVA